MNPFSSSLFASSSCLSVLSLGLQFPQVFSSELLVLHSKEFSEVVLVHIQLEIDTVLFTFREGNGNPLQYSCLENPMEGGAFTVVNSTVHRSTATGRGCMHTTVYTRHGNSLMWLDVWTRVHLFESLKLEGSCVGTYSHLVNLHSSIAI